MHIYFSVFIVATCVFCFKRQFSRAVLLRLVYCWYSSRNLKVSVNGKLDNEFYDYLRVFDNRVRCLYYCEKITLYFRFKLENYRDFLCEILFHNNFSFTLFL